MDWSQSTRDRLAASERQINEARMKREQETRIADRAQRERLEKASPSGARRSLVNILNGMEHERAPVALPGLDAITKIRDGQRYGYRTAADHNRAYERFEKSAGFNRLHPGSRLSRAASDFDFRPGEPGNKDGSRFQWGGKFDPPQRAGQMESDGKVRGESRYQPSDAVEGIEPEFLLAVARELIEQVRRYSLRFPAGRRD